MICVFPLRSPGPVLWLRLPERRWCGCSLGLRNRSQPWNLTFNLRCHATRSGKAMESSLAFAPPEDVPLIRFMIDHEESFSKIAAREALGEPAMESELVVMLAHPFARADSPPRN